MTLLGLHDDDDDGDSGIEVVSRAPLRSLARNFESKESRERLRDAFNRARDAAAEAKGGVAGGMWVDKDGVTWTTPSNMIANRIYIKRDTPYSFIDRPCMKTVFDDDHRFILMKTARQVSKSTTLAGRLMLNTEVLAPYAALFLSPSYDQTSKFSHQRLGPTIMQSPHLKARMSREMLNNVLEKEFIDGSRIYLSYAKSDADRARGISVDEIDFDEVQDMHLSAIEPVVQESLFTSVHKKRFYSGTPKSFSNGIEGLWRNSDQREWMVACRHHSPAYHQKLTIKNIGNEGPVCVKCGNLLNTLDGLWVQTVTVLPDGKKPETHGYHLPQIIFPTNKVVLGKKPNGKDIKGFLDWDDLLLRLSNPNAEIATIQNEIFGESADSASKPISEEKLRSLCHKDRPMPTEYPAWAQGTYTFAGVDWGMGLGSSTVLSIGQFDPRDPSKFRIIFCKRWDGGDADPEICVPLILQYCRWFRVKRLHADWGGGAGINSRIMDELGPEFITTNYWSTNMSAKMANYDDRHNRFVLNRSMTITKFFQALRRDSIQIAFRWEDYREFSVDILNVFREERKNEDYYYDHPPGTQDDAMHSHIYCWLVACWHRINENFVEDARITGSTHNPLMV
jgi:hypothetical protein